MGSGTVRSMEEFATLSGISRPTLSKYFNNPNSVRQSTRTKIEKALEKFDYQPNIFAINQNRKLTKNIGIVVPFLADPFFAEMARTIERRCLDAGFWPMLFSSHGDPELEKDILGSLRALKAAGVLLAPLGKTSDRAHLEKFCGDVPTVLFDSSVEGLGEAFVGSNNFQSVPMMVEYLCRTGEPPCFLEMPPLNPNANKRRNAYCQAMEQLGHTPQVVRVDGENWSFEEIGFRGGQKTLEEGVFDTNTVLCSNDRLAIGFLSACFERGLKVGYANDCSIRVAGHDDHPFSRFTCPSLTTIGQDYESISNLSVETLFSRIENGPLPERVETLFDGNLIMRGSA
ncbi:MAG: LacI family DNA-binding transcriptional regulator [Pseudomonadota bacterium]